MHLWTNITINMLTISSQDHLGKKKEYQSFRLYSIYVIIFFSCHHLASIHSALFFNDLFQFIVVYITSITSIWITHFRANFVFECPSCIPFFSVPVLNLRKWICQSSKSIVITELVLYQIQKASLVSSFLMSGKWLVFVCL